MNILPSKKHCCSWFLNISCDGDKTMSTGRMFHVRTVLGKKESLYVSELEFGDPY